MLLNLLTKGYKKMKHTLKSFIANSHINPTLIRAVVRQLGGYDEFKESAQYITWYGISGGYGGFIYYTDTVAFTKKHKKAILELANNLADDIGEDTIKMIAGFNCLKMNSAETADAIYNPKSDNRTYFFNALAWFAAEEVCNSYINFIEA